jgi:hypothetical protein
MDQFASRRAAACSVKDHRDWTTHDKQNEQLDEFLTAREQGLSWAVVRQ